MARAARSVRADASSRSSEHASTTSAGQMINLAGAAARRRMRSRATGTGFVLRLAIARVLGTCHSGMVIPGSALVATHRYAREVAWGQALDSILRAAQHLAPGIGAATVSSRADHVAGEWVVGRRHGGIVVEPGARGQLSIGWYAVEAPVSDGTLPLLVSAEGVSADSAARIAAWIAGVGDLPPGGTVL